MTHNPLLALHDLLDQAGIPLAGPGSSHHGLVERVQMLVEERDRLQGLLTDRARQTDYDALLASLDEDRGEVLMLLADACLDSGREQDAKGWGWLHMTNRWPVRVGKSWGWVFCADSLVPLPDRPAHVLPRSLLHHFGDNPDMVYKFSTCRAALEAVMKAQMAGKPLEVPGRTRTAIEDYLRLAEEWHRLRDEHAGGLALGEALMRLSDVACVMPRGKPTPCAANWSGGGTGRGR